LKIIPALFSTGTILKNEPLTLTLHMRADILTLLINSNFKYCFNVFLYNNINHIILIV
jgi:hypothetical protein